MDRKFVPPIKSLKINEGVICISLSRAKSLCKSLDAERLVCFPFERAGKTRCNRSFRQLTNVIEEKFEQQGSVLNRCRVNRSRKLEIIWPSCRPKWLNYGGRETGKALGNIRSESRANSSLLHQRVRRHCPHETLPSLHLPRLDFGRFLETFLNPPFFTTFWFIQKGQYRNFKFNISNLRWDSAPVRNSFIRWNENVEIR